jgi:hypothetical protein
MTRIIAVMTHDEWKAEGERRFGADMSRWEFVCPVCGHHQTVQACRDAKVPDSCIGFSCIGRWLPKSREAFGGKGDGPCNYAGGGLFKLNPIAVSFPDGTEARAFAFAEGATTR